LIKNSISSIDSIRFHSRTSEKKIMFD